MKERKSLQERFLRGDKLNLVDELRIKISQYCTDCDGMCGAFCDVWYCEQNRVSYEDAR